MRAFWHQNKKWLIPVLLFIFAFSLRLYFLYPGFFHHDVAQSGKIIEEAVFDKGASRLGSNVFFSNRIFYLFVNYLFFLTYSFFGGEHIDILMNVSSALFAALACILMYYFVLELTEKKHVALFSSLFLAVTPIFLSDSTYGKEHALQIFVMLSGLYLLLRALREEKKSLFFLAGIVTGLFLITREDSFLFLPLFAYILFFLKKKGSNISNVSYEHLLFFSVPILFIFAWYLYFTLWDRLLVVLFQKEETAGVWLGFFSYIFPDALYDLLVTLTPLLCALAIYGMYRMYLTEKKLFGFLSIWIAYLLYFGNNDIYAPRWLSILLPPFLIAGAYGIGALSDYEKKGEKWIKKIVVPVVFVTLIWMFLTIYPVLNARADHALTKEYAQAIDTLAPSGAHLFFYADACTIITYYSPKISCSGNSNTQEVKREIKEKIEQGVPIYFTPHRAKLRKDLDFAKELSALYNSTLIMTRDYEDYHKATLTSVRFEAPLFLIQRSLKLENDTNNRTKWSFST